MTQDKKLISFRQFWEIQWIWARYGIPKSEIRSVMHAVGKGRHRVYNELKRRGYNNLP